MELVNAFFSQSHHQQQQQQQQQQAQTAAVASGGDKGSTQSITASRLQQQQLYMMSFLTQDQDELTNIESKGFKKMLYQLMVKYVLICGNFTHTTKKETNSTIIIITHF